jgi:hypothetical protein
MKSSAISLLHQDEPHRERRAKFRPQVRAEKLAGTWRRLARHVSKRARSTLQSRLTVSPPTADT